MSGLTVPFDKVIEILSETEINTKGEICIALEELKNGYPDKEYWERERASYNRAIADAIQVVKNH
jgi:hypothetical protein